MSSSSSGISPSNNPAHKTKDGIIRMLLQTATPNTAPLLPTSPLPPVYSASHLSSSIPLPQTPHFGSNPLVGSSPSSLGHLGGAIPQTGGLVLPISPSLMAGSGSGGGIGPSSGQHETEDEKANNYIHQIAGCVRSINNHLATYLYLNLKPKKSSQSNQTCSGYLV